MSVSSKLTERSQELVQEEIVGAAVVQPPGATLYGGYASKRGSQRTALTSALDSKLSSKADGLAGRMPRQQGALIRTPTRLLFLKLKRISGKPVEVMTGWTHDEISSISYSPPDSGSYPGVRIEYSDGTDVTVFGEKNCGLETLA